MVDATHKSFRADDRSYFSLLKKEIHHKVTEAGFSANRTGEIDIIVSEMTSNLFKYAKDGEILFSHHNGDDEYIEIISIDNGPGMNEAQRMVADGMSTTNTLGHGLGSISRLSDKFDIYSQKGWGTILLSRVYKNQAPAGKQAVNVHALITPKVGETFSGDGYYFDVVGDFARLMVADGLGHGEEANKAVNEAVAALKDCPSVLPADIIRHLHYSIRKTRGVVATLATYNLKAKTWNIAGVGNISLKLSNILNSKNYISYNGIIGHNIPTSIKDQLISHEEYNQLIFCSDGIKSRWEASKYPMINKFDPSILAAAIYKDFSRKTDDMSVVIIKTT